ncbi:type IV pilus inner membrane component PilO [Paenibacillus glycinis]|uniref:Pilus assembly protein PilO n=1 Tax=Paenibacillus glycinis TaxID=2697035 RepID=A0ABW9XRS2_9BACL|nr:hypothetical protein [Paenibacillus glycinis]NBD25343.1 hypothetical protein [Paenibacillus glycinis]
MEQLNKNRSLMLLVLAVLFLVLFAAYMYVVKPAASEVNDQEERISTLDKQRTLLQKKLGEKQEQAAAYSGEDVQRALPLWDNTEHLLLDLQGIEGRSGAQTLSAAFNAAGGDDASAEDEEQAEGGGEETNQAAALPSGIKRLKTSAVVKGTYEQVLNYVDALQKLKRLITIDSLDIAKSSDGTGASPVIKINLAFTAYFDPSYRDQVSEVLQPYSE